MNPLNSFAQLAFDSNCILSLIYWQIRLHERHPNISSLLSPYVSRDLAVFLYEAFLLLERDSENSKDEDSLLEFREDIRIMRNNIHQLVTRDKKFTMESERIYTSTEQLQSIFKTNQGNILSLFAHDIGLTKASTPEGELLIATTLFPWFLLDRTSMVDETGPIGSRIRDHSFTTKEIVKAFTDVLNIDTGNAFEVSLNLPLAEFDESMIYHEDIKLAQIQRRTVFPKELIYSLMLILDEIGEFLFFSNYIVNKNAALQDDCTLFFLTKALAVRYDEAFDTLWRFRNKKDYRSDATELLNSQLAEHILTPQKKSLRDFGKRLRNTIHYNNTSWNPAINGNSVDHVPAFLEVVGAQKWPDDYLSKYNEMEKELQKLHSYLSGLFNIKGARVDM